MFRNFVADESGLSTFTWALLIGAIAVAAVMYFPQLHFVIAALGQLWVRLNLPMIG